MRVWIDQDLCTGDGLCEEIAPDVFFGKDDGLFYVKETAYGEEKNSMVLIIQRELTGWLASQKGAFLSLSKQLKNAPVNVSSLIQVKISKTVSVIIRSTCQIK